MDHYIKETVKFYDEHTEEVFEKTKGLQDTPWLEKFISYLPRKAMVLDLGCGYGRDCRFFVAKGIDTYGVDLSAKMIQKATKLVQGAKFCVMNVLELHFGNKYFDGVWASAILIHLNKTDVVKALKEVRRVLKKEGILYLNLKEGKGEGFIRDERYEGARKFYSYFSTEEIKKLIVEQGFFLLDFELVKDKKDSYSFTGAIFLIARKV